MAHYLTNNEKFHIFSKSPVLSSMAVSQAVNKSGHTVSTNDVWADDVPWFTEVADEAGAITRAADARYNDLILWGSDIYVRKGDKTNGASTGTTFDELWEKHTDLTAARAYALGSVTTQTPTNIVTKTVELKNASDKVVVKYHVGKQIDLLTTANNANVASTWAARMFIDGKVVDQFVSPTDKVFAGNPSTGYTTLVYTATTAGNKYDFVAEGEADGDFVNNAFAGIVQFNQSRTSTHKFAASVFEYVGGKLDATVASLSAAVFGEGGGEDDPDASLTQKVAQNTSAIGTIEDTLWGENGSATTPAADSVMKDIENLQSTVGTLVTGVSSVTISNETYTDAKPGYAIVNQTSTKGNVAVTIDTSAIKSEVTGIANRVSTLESGKLRYQVVHSVDDTNNTYKETADATTSTACEVNVIYLVPNDLIGAYVEYLCVENSAGNKIVEQIGTTATDLDGYATKLTTDATKSSDANKLVKVTVTSGVTDAVKSVAVDDTTLSNTIGVPADTSTNTKATGLYKVIEEAKNAAISEATVTITAGTGISLAGADGDGKVTGNSFTISANTASTTAAGIVQLTDSVTSTSTTTAATPNAVKSVADTISGHINETDGKLHITAEERTRWEAAVGTANSAIQSVTKSGSTAALSVTASQTGVGVTIGVASKPGTNVDGGVQYATFTNLTEQGYVDQLVDGIEGQIQTLTNTANGAVQSVTKTSGSAAALTVTDGTTVEIALSSTGATSGTQYADRTSLTEKGYVDEKVANLKSSKVGGVDETATSGIKLGTTTHATDDKVVTLTVTPATIGTDGTLANGNNVVTGNVAQTLATTAASSAVNAIAASGIWGTESTDSQYIKVALNYDGTDKLKVTANDIASAATLQQLSNTVEGLTTGVSSVTLTKTKDDYDLLVQSGTTGDVGITLDTTKLETAINAKANSADIVTYTGTGAISVPTSGTSREISVAAASSDATGTVKLAGTSGVADTTENVVATAAQVKTYVDGIDGTYTATGVEEQASSATGKSAPSIKLTINHGATDGKVTIEASDIASQAALDYLRTTVTDHIAAAAKIGIEIATPVSDTDRTPDVESPSTGKIYLVPATTEEDEVGGTYVEWIYAGGWVRIGTTATDLGGYVKSSTLLSNTVNGNAGVSITQEGGNVTGVTVTSTSVKTDGTLENGDKVVTGNVAKTIATNIVNGLDATVKDTETNPAITITETDGKLTGVTLAIGSGTQQGGNGVTLTQATNGTVTLGVTADTEVIEGSTNVVTGGAVHTAIATAQAAATTKVQKAATTATADVTDETNDDGSTTYTIDTLSDVTITATDVADATSVEGNKINGANKYVDWSRVTSAANAFASNTSLKSFHADLENLTNGNGMFSGCTGLTSFCGNLGSLTDGTNMFAGCNLDLESVIYIVDSLPAHSSGTHSITIGVNSALVSENEINALTNELSAKGWGGSVNATTTA